MAEVSREVVEHVAMLARLELSEDEIRRLQHELGRILEHANRLQQVDTENVPGTSHVLPMVNVYREDEVAESLSPEEAVANAPDHTENLIRVPRIVE